MSSKKSNQNYFSNTEEVYDLIRMLLKEIYSKEISDLGIDLLLNGSSTLFEIQSRLKLSFENVRNYLIIMLQNNLIIKSSIERKDVKYTSYELNTEQILNILLFPRTLNFVEKKYGIYGKMIFEQFIEFGILTLHQIIEQIQNNQNIGNGNNFELVKTQVIDIFMRLFNENLILYCDRSNEDEGEKYYVPAIKNIKNSNSIVNKEEPKKSNNKKFNRKKRC